MAKHHPVVSLISLDVERSRIVLGFGNERERLRAYDLDTFEEDWARTLPAGKVIANRGGLILIGGSYPTVAEVAGGESGDLLLDGWKLGFHHLGLSEGGRWIWGEGRDSLALFVADEVAERAEGARAATPLPVIQLWDVSGHAVAVACDGTWSALRVLLERDGRVLIGDRLESAPWLLDPLHVRAIDADRDRRLRRFPALK